MGVGSAGGIPRSHAEIVAAIPAYAAGVLAGRPEDAIRRHLAGGCRDCLDELFRLPVGVARGVRTEAASRGDAVSVVSAVLLVIALTGTVVASTMWLVGGVGPSAVQGVGRRKLIAIKAHAWKARERVASHAARGPVRGDDVASHVGASGDGRSPVRHDAATERALAQLGSALSVVGTRVEHLRSDASGTGARGWLIWDPLHGRLFVYAVGLPPIFAPWEAHVLHGGEAHALPLRRLVDGSLWALLDHVEGAEQGTQVRIVPPGASRTVLAGGLAPCRGAPGT